MIIFLFYRFLWLRVAARPEEHLNQSNQQTNSDNTKTGLETTEQLQAIKMKCQPGKYSKRWREEIKNCRHGLW